MLYSVVGENNLVHPHANTHNKESRGEERREKGTWTIVLCCIVHVLATYTMGAASPATAAADGR